MRISDWSSDVCSSDLTGCSTPSGAHRWATRVRDPPRRPLREAERKSGPLVRRCSRGSTSARNQQRGSDSELAATLAATAVQNGAASAGAQAQAETVHLVTAAVVRLVGTLAHDYNSPKGLCNGTIGFNSVSTGTVDLVGGPRCSAW